jgi:hypothetical protein
MTHFSLSLPEEMPGTYLSLSPYVPSLNTYPSLPIIFPCLKCILLKADVDGLQGRGNVISAHFLPSREGRTLYWALADWFRSNFQKSFENVNLLGKESTVCVVLFLIFRKSPLTWRRLRMCKERPITHLTNLAWKPQGQKARKHVMKQLWTG